jgi:hypothetical protein
VADVDGVIAVRMATTNAVLRVGRVLEAGARPRRVVDPEPEHLRAPLCERRDERVVGVHHERGLRGELTDRLAPPFRDVLELAVAVELVAEQVAQADGAGPGAPHDLGEGELVHLEQPEIGVLGGEEGRGDTGGEVRPRVVPGEPAIPGEDRARHRGRRRLAVRRRHERGPVAETGGERVERAGIELPDELAR